MSFLPEEEELPSHISHTHSVQGADNLVSHKLSDFCEKFGSFTAVQFAYGKGLGYDNALLNISHHIQRASNVGQAYYVVSLTLVQNSTGLVTVHGLIYNGSLLVSQSTGDLSRIPHGKQAARYS